MSTTDEKVIKAAIREFAEYGFEGARMDRIAKNAKVNKAMIYYHYQSKEKLYESILSFHTKGIHGFIKTIIPDRRADMNQIYTLIGKLLEYLNNLQPEFFRIMLREFAGGGKYIRKFIFPNLIAPISSLLLENLNREIERKNIKPVHPFYTYQQIIGSIIFFNIMRIGFKGTDLYDILYSENYLEKFTNNLISVIKYGIEPDKES
ncbi:MAG: TetR/AcrR family transcriptional regulator [Spirochaetes bacterium]|nr:TetR/AcrR family transcriptional regulator [Spirochaetota bacterium]